MRYLLANGQYLRIREASLEDAVALLDMYRQAVKETDFLTTTPAEAERFTLAYEREFISAYEHNDNQLLLVADVEGVLAGTVSVTRARPAKQQHTGELGIVVLQKYWNMGIARRMITATLQWAEKNPAIHYIFLTAIANNEKAIRLYRNFGFMEEGRRPGAVRQEDHLFQDMIMMGKKVKQAPG